MKTLYSLLLLASITVSAVPDGVEEFTLSNGISVITRYIPGREVEGFSLFIIGGSGTLTSDTQGLEALAVECAMMGSVEYPGPLWREIMDITQAEWTGTYNYDFSRYHLRCLSEDLELLCRCFADCLINPELDPQAFEQVRERMFAELQQEMDDPDNVIWQVANRAFMKDHTYRLLPGGTTETISTFVLEDVRKTLSERILAGNLLITHAGPTNAADLEELLEETFARIPTGRSILQDVAPFVLSADTLTRDHDEVSTAFAVVKFNAPPCGHPDVPAFKVGMQAVDERLWQVLRTEHGLTYATYAGVSGYDQSWGYMYVSSPSPLKACSLMASVMAQAITEPFDEEMLKGVIQVSRTYDGINAQNMSSQCYLMGWGWINTGDWRTAYMYTDIADGLNAEDVRAVLDRWINFSGWGIIADTSLVREGELVPWPVRPMEDDL